MSRAWHIARTHDPIFREEKAWSDLSVVPRRNVLLYGPLHPSCMVTFVKPRRLRCLLAAVSDWVLAETCAIASTSSAAPASCLRAGIPRPVKPAHEIAAAPHHSVIKPILHP